MSEAAKVSVTNPTVFSRAQLRRIRAPALLLIGDEEKLYDPAAMLALAQWRMPGPQRQLSFRRPTTSPPWRSPSTSMRGSSPS